MERLTTVGKRSENSEIIPRPGDFDRWVRPDPKPTMTLSSLE